MLQKTINKNIKKRPKKKNVIKGARFSRFPLSTMTDVGENE